MKASSRGVCSVRTCERLAGHGGKHQTAQGRWFTDPPKQEVTVTCADCGMRLDEPTEYHPAAACALRRFGYRKFQIQAALEALGKHPTDWVGEVQTVDG